MNQRFAFVLRASGALALLLFLTGGCVSLDKYRQLEFAERNCQAERERLSGELATCQVQNRDLQNKIDEIQADLTNKNQMIRALQGDAQTAQQTMQQMVSAYEQLANSIPRPGATVALPAELDTALKEFAAKYPDMVQYDSERGVVKFGTDLLFDLGSADVRSDKMDELRELAGIITSPAAQGFDVVVVGHTDNLPIVKAATKAKFPTNWHLSAARAIGVMDELTNGGVSSERVGIMGYGEFRPAVPKTSSENRQQNRRVEVYLVPEYAVGAEASEAAEAAKVQPAAPAVEK